MEAVARSQRVGHLIWGLAAETAATLRELMERMGHRSTRAALIYLHARDHRDQAIADGLDTIIGTAALGGQQECAERATGIEPAWPAWKAAYAASSGVWICGQAG